MRKKLEPEILAARLSRRLRDVRFAVSQERHIQKATDYDYDRDDDDE